MKQTMDRWLAASNILSSLAQETLPFEAKMAIARAQRAIDAERKTFVETAQKEVTGEDDKAKERELWLLAARTEVDIDMPRLKASWLAGRDIKTDVTPIFELIEESDAVAEDL